MYLHELFLLSEELDQAPTLDALFEFIPAGTARALGLTRVVAAIVDEGWIKIKSAYFEDQPDMAKVLNDQALELVVSGQDPLPRACQVWTTVVQSEWQDCICRGWMGLSQCYIIPVMSQGKTLAVVFAGSTDQETGEADDVIEVCAVLSKLIAHAMESINTRDLAESVANRARRRIAELSLLQETSRRLRSQDTIEGVLATLIDEIHTVIDYSGAVAAVYDPDDREWTVATRGHNDLPITGYEQQIRRVSLDALADFPPTIASNPDDCTAVLADIALEDCEAHLYVPIESEESLFGFCLLGSTKSDTFKSSDLRFTIMAAETAAAVIHRTRLYSRTLKSEEKLRAAFDQVAVALSSGLDLDQVLSTIAQVAASMSNADGAAVLMLDQDMENLVVKACHGLDVAVVPGTALPLKHTIAVRAIIEKRRIVADDVSGMGAIVPALADDTPVGSLVSVAIIVGETASGVLEVYARQPHTFSSDDASMLCWFADHAATALSNARAFKHERSIAEAFQSSLLEVTPPKVRGYDVAVRYQAALEEATTGGDFYDFLPLDDGKIGIVVGDVSGKGLGAAVYTAMAKYMLRAFAMEDPTPSLILERLNDALCRYTSGDKFLTLFYGVLDPGTSEVTYSSAGHQPPLLSCPDGTRELGEIAGGLPLGIVPGAVYKQESIVIAAGCAMLVFTDGIVEARHNGNMFGVEGMIAVASKYQQAPVSKVVDEIFYSAQACAGGRLGDDAVLMAIRRAPVRANTSKKKPAIT